MRLIISLSSFLHSYRRDHRRYRDDDNGDRYNGDGDRRGGVRSRSRSRDRRDRRRDRSRSASRSPAGGKHQIVSSMDDDAVHGMTKYIPT